MKAIKYLSMLTFAMLVAITFTACSDDDDEGNVNALKGNTILFNDYKDYRDGEVVGTGSQSWFLYKNGSAGLGGSSYDSAKWYLEGNSIVINYYSDGEVADTEKYTVENVYSFGKVVIRIDINSGDVDYRRIEGSIDSEDYDDAVTPDWWYEEWG